MRRDTTPAGGAPLGRLMAVIAFMLTVATSSTLAYMHAGWSFGDSLYMVLLTVYSVGYGEVRPVDTPYLHAVTVATIVVGCTGMIAVTGTLVQALTYFQLQQFVGGDRLKNQIDKLAGHVIICGYGRIGLRLAGDLTVGGASVVILERDEASFAEARDAGYLCWHGDATDETALRAVGVERAQVLATVLPSDAANVFITLSARSLNATLKIIARAEEPSTERKLIQAGADQVVLPTQIGAERMADIVLFPETARFIQKSERMQSFEKTLRDLGLEFVVVVVEPRTAVVGLTVGELEVRAKGAFFVVQIERADGEYITRPPEDLKIETGDSLLVVGRGGGPINTVFRAAADRVRAGRTTW